MDKNLIAAFVATSDFGVMRSALDIVSGALTPETESVLSTAILQARKRLDDELSNSFMEDVGISNVVDPILFVDEVEESIYSEMCDDMESGWNSPLPIGVDNPMKKVGYIRKLVGYNSSPDDLFIIRDTLKEMCDESARAEHSTFADAANLSRNINLLILSMCSPTGTVRQDTLSLAVNYTVG